MGERTKPDIERFDEEPKCELDGGGLQLNVGNWRM